MIKEILNKLEKQKTEVHRFNSIIVNEQVKGNINKEDYEWLKVSIEQNIAYLETLKNTIDLAEKVKS